MADQDGGHHFGPIGPYVPTLDIDDDSPAAGPVDQDRIRRAVREILLAVGEDPDREGLVETPDRVARMYAEVFGGLHLDPAIHLRKLFTQEYDEMVLVKDIQFASFCEHHLLPFTGVAHVAYLPKGRVVGLSKIPRVLDVLSRRPQVQETANGRAGRAAHERAGGAGRRGGDRGDSCLHDDSRGPQRGAARA